MMALEILIMVSWVTYFIPYDSYTGRLSPLIVVLLAQINILLRIHNDLPTLNSMGVLQLFVMGSICQSSFVIASYRSIIFKKILLFTIWVFYQSNVCFIKIRSKLNCNNKQQSQAQSYHFKMQMAFRSARWRWEF